jgi:hypothetical protein
MIRNFDGETSGKTAYYKTEVIFLSILKEQDYKGKR